jgi:hypothetical protein
MACRLCGGGDAWIKTCRTLDGEIVHCCDPCYEALRQVLMIVPGPVCVHGKCLSCGEWMNPRELVDVKPGAAGKGDAPGGTCIGCHEIAATEGGG